MDTWRYLWKPQIWSMPCKHSCKEWFIGSRLLRMGVWQRHFYKYLCHTGNHHKELRNTCFVYNLFSQDVSVGCSKYIDNTVLIVYPTKKCLDSSMVEIKSKLFVRFQFVLCYYVLSQRCCGILNISFKYVVLQIPNKSDKLKINLKY